MPWTKWSTSSSTTCSCWVNRPYVASRPANPAEPSCGKSPTHLPARAFEFRRSRAFLGAKSHALAHGGLRRGEAELRGCAGKSRFERSTRHVGIAGGVTVINDCFVSLLAYSGTIALRD